MLWQISVRYSSVICVLNIWLCNSECVQKNPQYYQYITLKIQFSIPLIMQSILQKVQKEENIDKYS